MKPLKALLREIEALDVSAATKSRLLGLCGDVESGVDELNAQVDDLKAKLRDAGAAP